MDDTQALGGDGSRPTLAGRYEIRGLLGQGGMADVVLARDRQLDRDVAVKILHARYADDPAFLARFRREAQAAASLTHPNIVAVYDAGEDQSRPFIVMEHVSGRSLSDVLKKERVDPDRALGIVGDAALGVHFAHERGLIHRDIKPGNILVSDDGQVKVTDFGIARAVNAENMTQTATVFGTAAYVAPEQAQGQEVDRRTDVYALGCVLYELLAGRQPFAADTAVALAYKHVAEMPPAPSELNPDLSPELDAIVLKAMAKDPEERYATARELNADLQRAEAGLPVSAPPIAAWASAASYGSDRTAVLTPTATAGDPPGYAPDPGYDDADDRGSRGLWLVLLGIIVLAIFALAGVLLANLLRDQTVEVSVPSVVGMDLAEAQAEIRDAGLIPLVSDEQVETDDVDEGQVARTDPEADTVVDEGADVTLFVSGGPPTATIPELEGLPESEAERELLELGFSLGVAEREPHDEIEEDHVITSDPASGDTVPVDTEVVLVISEGPESVTMPDVVDMEEDEAVRELEGLCSPRPCLTVEVEYVESEEVDEGIVIEQDPDPDTDVTINGTVGLLVSEGVQSVELPDVRNQSEALAIERLEGACDADPCVRVSVQRDYHESVREGRVISQDPEGGSSVEVGDAVTIVVSDGQEPVDDDDDDDDDDNGGGGDDDGDDDEGGNGNGNGGGGDNGGGDGDGGN